MRWKVFPAAVLSVILAGVPAAAAAKYGERQVAELVSIAEAEKEPEARRARAIRELEHTEHRTHLSLLRRLLREERSLDIRLAAACTLAAHGDRKAPRDLLLVSAYDRARTPSCTRSDVFLALARVGDPAAELHLGKAVEEAAPMDEPYFYQDLCRALSLLNTPGSRQVLLRALRAGTYPELRHAAVSPLIAVARDRTSPEAAEAFAALLVAARQDPEERVAEQAASALFWGGVDGKTFYLLLEDPDPKIRIRAARVMNRHYLTPARLERLRAALAREQAPEVRAAMERTLGSQARM